VQRRNVIPAAAILIVRNDNRPGVPDIAVLHSADDICDMLLASNYDEQLSRFHNFDWICGYHCSPSLQTDDDLAKKW
jgi:hypothetical protein